MGETIGKGATGRFCERLAGIGPDNMTPAALAAAKQLVLDGIAIAVAGTAERAIAIFADHHRLQAGAAPGDGVTLLGLGGKLPPVAAAAVNGAAMHVLDFEPMWSPANHALSTTLPAVLALAEWRGATGLDVLTALVKGCEAQGWLRQASGQFEPRALVFHPPGIAGPIGSAVAAGHLLQLDPNRLAHAVGIAASSAGTLLANVGTMTKSLHCGKAAAAGLEAALLASTGFTANPDALEARQGFAAAFFPNTFNPDELLKAGPPFRVVQPGYALKMFPSQYGTHFAITAALELHRRIGDPRQLRAVTLTAPVMPYIDRQRPVTGLDGKFSLQYTASAALLDGKVGIETFSDERLAAADMQDLLGKFVLVMDPAIPAHFEGMHVHLAAETADGRSFAARCDGPLGSWRAAALPEAAHLAKVRDCLAVRLPEADAEECIRLAGNLERLDAAAMRRMVGLAGRGSAPG